MRFALISLEGASKVAREHVGTGITSVECYPVDPDRHYDKLASLPSYDPTNSISLFLFASVTYCEHTISRTMGYVTMLVL